MYSTYIQHFKWTFETSSRLLFFSTSKYLNFRVISKNRKKHVVRISNLPEDVTSKELVDLISEWGEIGNVNIKSYSESVSSYIDFYNKNEADYFVEALDTTPFDHYIIKVEIMNF